jgi:hypothetical protein
LSEQIEDRQLENRIRRAFEPLDLEIELDQIVRQPAIRRRGRRWVTASTLAACMVFAVVGLVLWSPLGERPAFGWTKDPRVPTPDDAAAIDAVCAPMAQGLPLKVIDVRGDAAAAFYSDGPSYSLCLAAKTSTGWNPLASGGGSGRPPADLTATMTMSTPLLQTTSELGTRTLKAVVGRVPTVTQTVQITLSDGTTVDASLANGTYLAWWPSDVAISSATAYGPTDAPIECTVLTC